MWDFTHTTSIVMTKTSRPYEVGVLCGEDPDSALERHLVGAGSVVRC